MGRFDSMDAKAILSSHFSKELPFPAVLEHGGDLSEIRVRILSPYGMVISGINIPELNSLVTVHIDTMTVAGIISAKSGGDGSILYIRPASSADQPDSDN